MTSRTRSSRCQGRRLNGDLCQRRASGYCWQHKSQGKRRALASGRIVKQNNTVVSGLPIREEEA